MFDWLDLFSKKVGEKKSETTCQLDISFDCIFQFDKRKKAQ
jgi:hypothetical protein